MIACNQYGAIQRPEIRDFLHMDCPQRSGALQQRLEGPGESSARTGIAPQFFEATLIKKGGRKIRLWVEIGGQHPVATLRKHPRPRTA